MARFAVAVTLVELALTGLTAALFTLESPPDPFLTPDDLREFSLPFESHETARRLRFDALLGYDSNAVLLHPRQTLWVSLRVEQTAVDFQSRRRREESWAARPGQISTTAVVAEPGADGEGYAVRQRSPSGARCELVRFKGDRMLVVRISKAEPLEKTPEEEVAACERRARLIQARMLQKTDWTRAGPR